MHFKINGKKWLILRVRLKDWLGWCYRGERVILIDKKLKGRDLKYVAIHETLHALRWSKSEKDISKAVDVIMEVLDAIS